VNAVIGAVCFLLGIAAVYVAMPNKGGESPRFLRSGALDLLYPVLCLFLLIMGVAIIIGG
jgi:hypothetical protein